MAASDPAWAPCAEGVGLDAAVGGTVYRCGACGFRTQPHEDLKECAAD